MIELPIHKARLERSLASCCYDVHILAGKRPGQVEILMPLGPQAFMTVIDGTYHAQEPAFQLSEQSAQALLDAMWEIGIRPSSGNAGTGDDRTVKAMQEHITDLRHMAGIQPVSADTPRQASTY